MPAERAPCPPEVLAAGGSGRVPRPRVPGAGGENFLLARGPAPGDGEGSRGYSKEVRTLKKGTIVLRVLNHANDKPLQI